MELIENRIMSQERSHAPLAEAWRAPNLPSDLANYQESDDTSVLIDPLELEALGMVIEYSLKIQSTHQFYRWSQGLLQNLIRHELLICALRKSDSASFHIDSFSTATNPVLINGLFGQDTALLPGLLDAWEANHFQPVTLDVRKFSGTGDSALVRELKRIEANHVLAHGTYDASGKPVSFFIFACRSINKVQRQAHLAELLVPSLHAAWVHTMVARPATLEIKSSQQTGPVHLTAREHEILTWIYRGKSNIEIGMILGISQFTVKNHVQKILRRLNVLNRAQAVGKALVLRIFEAV
jgi:transcriptional regulator EpsA